MVSFWSYLVSKFKGNALAAGITLAELKEKWASEHYTRITHNASLAYEFAWNKIPQEMKEKAFLDLKWIDWQTVITTMRTNGLAFYSQKRIKNLCGQLYRYAIRNELCEKNYAPLLEMSKNVPVREKVIYTDDEIRYLLDHQNDNDNIKMILLLIFTGVRISELLRIKPAEDVFMDEKYFIVRKSKTVAGTNRPIPIYREIIPIFNYFISKGHHYLITRSDGQPMDYKGFRYRYMRTMKALGMKHTIHECRHTFASILDDVGANDMCIRRMIGHVGVGVTKKVYTHKSLAQLHEAMHLLEEKFKITKETEEIN